MKIITHPQSRAYDEGWDAIFGSKAEVPLGNNPVQDAPGSEPPVAAPESPAEPAADTDRGVRMPRGWTPKNG